MRNVNAYRKVEIRDMLSASKLRVHIYGAETRRYNVETLTKVPKYRRVSNKNEPLMPCNNQR